MKTFFVICEETCSECNGSGRVHNPEWIAFGKFEEEWKEANPRPIDDYALITEYNRKWDEAEAAYWQEQGYRIYVDHDESWKNLPWDEGECPDCEGRKIIRSEIPLQEALKQLTAVNA